MGGLLTAILGAAGQSGSNLQEAKTLNQKERDRQLKLAQQTEQFKAQQQELQARLKQQGIEAQTSVAPQVVHTYKGADNKIHNLIRDPVSGKISDQIAEGATTEQSPLEQKIADLEKLLGRPLTPDEKGVLGGLVPKPTNTEDEYTKETERLRADEELRKRNPQMWRELHPGKDAGGPPSSAPLNPVDEGYAQAIVNKTMTLDQLAKVMVGKSGDARRQKIADRVVALGGFPSQMTPAAQKVVYTVDPTIKQVDKLLADIDRLKLGDKNTPGYLAMARAKYGLGMASPVGSLGSDIAGLSLGSVVEAATALMGASRSITALQIALQHTPNPWVDSPKLLKEKLTTIKDRLQDVMNDAKQFGTKSGLENTDDDLLPGEVIQK